MRTKETDASSPGCPAGGEGEGRWVWADCDLERGIAPGPLWAAQGTTAACQGPSFLGSGRVRRERQGSRTGFWSQEEGSVSQQQGMFNFAQGLTHQAGPVGQWHARANSCGWLNLFTYSYFEQTLIGHLMCVD